MEDLYLLKLHEVIHINEGCTVMRVIGGWVYESFIENGTGGYSISSCFVPEPPKDK